jgi:hypothetical protein
LIVDCAHYRDGRRQHDGPMELGRAADFCYTDDEEFVWLGLFEPSVEELAEVQQRFGLHDLAVEDVQNMHLGRRSSSTTRSRSSSCAPRATWTTSKRSTSARSECSSGSGS